MAIYDADAYVQGIEADEQTRMVQEAEQNQPPPPAPEQAVEAQPEQQQPQESIQEAAATAEPQANDNTGIVTQAGEAFGNLLNAPGDALNAVAAGLNQITPEGAGPLKQATQFLDDNIYGSEEYTEKLAQSSPAGAALAGGIEGTKAGLSSPFTIAGRLTNQDTPWSRAPAMIKDNDIAETVFNIAEIVVPTAVIGVATAGTGVPAALSGGTALVAESALETGLQDNVDDLILGRQLAAGMGQVAEYMGMDGAELTRDLIEGRKPETKLFNATVGFLQNLGINFGVNKIMAKFFPDVPNPPTDVEVRAGQITGKSGEEVQQSVSNVTQRAYTDAIEMDEAADVDSVVVKSLPSEGNVAVNSDAMVSEMLRPAADEDALTSSQRSYFSNYKPLAEEQSIQRVIDETTLTLQRLPDFPEDMKVMVNRAKEFWNANAELLDDDLPKLVDNFFDPKKGLVKGIDPRWNIGSDAFKASLEDVQQRMGVTHSGFIVGAAIGEELGIQIQKASLEALNLDKAGKDFSAAIENLIDLQDVANMFFVPIRRSKREWAVTGMSQQLNEMKALKNADIQPQVKSKTRKAPTQSDSFDTPFRDLTTIKKDYADPGMTLREMWDLARSGEEGSEEALSTLKYYLNYISYTDPRSVMKQVDNLTDVMSNQVARGVKDSISNIHYAFMLSGPASQTAAAVSGITRSIIEPASLMAEGVITGDKKQTMRGFGQLVGGFVHMGDATDMMVRAFKQGMPLNSGVKVEGSSAIGLAKKQAEIMHKYEGLIARAQSQNKNTLGLVIAKNLELFGQNKYLNGFTRMLMASDEFFKGTYAFQTAYGRAYENWLTKGDLKPENLPKLINGELGRTFKRGIESGVITDSEVLEGAKRMTFQADIPNDQYNNVIDNAFLGLQNMSHSNAIGRFFLPFTRMSYAALEASLVTFSGMTPMTRWAMSESPRYKAILNGTDDVAKAQLQSMFAAGQLMSISGIGLSAMGMMTGNNVEGSGLPPTSFIIPAMNEQGYIAIDYSRIEPYATTLAIMSDAVNSFRYGAISRHEYDKIVGEVAYSFGMAFTNKPFLQGLFKMSQILNIKNMNENYATQLTGMIASAASPALLKTAISIVQPYQTVVGGDNMIETIGSAAATAGLRGAGMPTFYDQYTGKSIPRTSTAFGDGTNYWAAVGGSILGLFAPGKVVSVDKDNYVKTNLREIGWENDNESSIKQYKGIKLSLDEQSILSKDLHDYGKLSEKLTLFFKGPGGKAIKKWRKLQEQGENDKALVVLNKIRQNVRSIHTKAKQDAVRYGRLGKNEEFLNKNIEDKLAFGTPPPQSSPVTQAQALVNWYNGNPVA